MTQILLFVYKQGEQLESIYKSCNGQFGGIDDMTMRKAPACLYPWVTLQGQSKVCEVPYLHPVLCGPIL